MNTVGVGWCCIAGVGEHLRNIQAEEHHKDKAFWGLDLVLKVWVGLSFLSFNSGATTLPRLWAF